MKAHKKIWLDFCWKKFRKFQFTIQRNVDNNKAGFLELTLTTSFKFKAINKRSLTKGLFIGFIGENN